jgi:hypothetical protein
MMVRRDRRWTSGIDLMLLVAAAVLLRLGLAGSSSTATAASCYL